MEDNYEYDIGRCMKDCETKYRGYQGKIEPTGDKPITFQVGVKANLYKELEGCPKAIIDDIELYRELAMINEIKKEQGHNIIDKMDSYLTKVNGMTFDPLKTNSKVEKYKLRYKY